MLFMEKHRLFDTQSEQTLLKMSWEGEQLGVGMFETLVELYPQHADVLTACATMEWFNVHYCERLGHAAGVSLKEAEMSARAGVEFARHAGSFENVARVTILETPAAAGLYKLLGSQAHSAELKALADDLVVHEHAMRDWLKSELDGKSDGGEKVFAYLERHGISKDEAVKPRKLREALGGDTQELVIAFFADEHAADEAVNALRDWDKATEYMKLDGIGVLVKDSYGTVKEHKLGRRAGKLGMGIGLVLGLIAAIPTGGLSLVGGVLGGAAAGGVIGQFFRKGLKMTDEDAARIGRELHLGRAAVGVLAWDFETKAVADKLAQLGGTPQTHEVAEVTAIEA